MPRDRCTVDDQRRAAPPEIQPFWRSGFRGYPKTVASSNRRLGKVERLVPLSSIQREPETLHRYDPETPQDAKHHRETKPGVQFTVGVKGVF